MAATVNPGTEVDSPGFESNVREILHISDIHFGPHHLPDVADGVVALAERRRPDLVVISGDLTHRAKPQQFQDARRYIDRFTVPTLAVPGNHDVPMYRVWERVLAPYGAYRKHFDGDMEPEWEDDTLAVIGVNTAFNWTVKDGRITRQRLRQLDERLAQVPESKSILIVAHHQLVPPPRFDAQRVITNAFEAADVFTRHGVDMVLSGHLHQCWIGSTEAYYPTARDPVLLVHSGTTTTIRGRGVERRRNTCNWIRVDEGSLEISHLRWEEPDKAFFELSRHRFPRRRRITSTVSRPHVLGEAF